jgi:hypothetical protein
VVVQGGPRELHSSAAKPSLRPAGPADYRRPPSRPFQAEFPMLQIEGVTPPQRITLRAESVRCANQPLDLGCPRIELANRDG